MFWKCFLPTYGFFFTVFIVSFDVQNFIFSLFHTAFLRYYWHMILYRLKICNHNCSCLWGPVCLVCFSYEFVILSPKFRSSVCVEWIFVYGVRWGLFSLLYTWVSSFPSTVCWEDCLYRMVMVLVLVSIGFCIWGLMFRLISLCFIPLEYISVFMSVAHCFAFSSFVRISDSCVVVLKLCSF